jgi:hypothetical protein
MDIAVDTVRYIIDKARELVLDERERDDDDDDDSPAFASSDEVDELREFIETLEDHEQAELVALAWIGQGTFTGEDWDEALDSAVEEHPRGVADYLLTFPLLADDLESGLEEMGMTGDEDE